MRAIVIGINDYPERSGLPKLQGAVADADAMQDWLKSTLGVPAGHIQVLRDHEATRIAILSALESWRDGPDVQQHDPLLIYFAGHGGAASIGSQALLPVDYIPGESPPILDRTFDELIMDIITKHRSAIVSAFNHSCAKLLSNLNRCADSNLRLLFSCDRSRWGRRIIPCSWKGLTSPRHRA